MLKKRLIIFPKDVQIITGRSERYAQRLLVKIKISFQKEPHQFVTVDEFAAFAGIPKEKIDPYIT
ncbi:hypothetical protein [Algoriphagus taiwanensis]